MQENVGKLKIRDLQVLNRTDRAMRERIARREKQAAELAAIEERKREEEEEAARIKAGGEPRPK